MLALKVVALLAIATVANGQTDVNQALWLMKCAKHVMANGCPDVEVPSYSPFKSRKVIDRVGHMGALHWGYKVKNIKIRHIPDYEVRLAEISKDNDTIARIRFNLWWPKWVYDGDYVANTTEGILQKRYNGKVTLTMHELQWTGEVDMVKPTPNAPQAEFIALDLTATAMRSHAQVEGAGQMGDTAARMIERKVKDTLESQIAKSRTERLIMEYLNHHWATNLDRTKIMINFCHKHGI